MQRWITVNYFLSGGGGDHTSLVLLFEERDDVLLSRNVNCEMRLGKIREEVNGL